MQPEYKSAEYLSCQVCVQLVDLELDAMLCTTFRHQATEQTVFTLIGQTGCVKSASRWVVWRMSITLFLIAQRIHTAISGQNIWTSCSTVVPLQTLCLCVNQMHVVVFIQGSIF